jgi:tetratricopeptide (TPR) repeat protein
MKADGTTEREAVPVVPIPKVSPGPTLESENEELRAALGALAVRESTDSHRRAAAEYWQARVFDQADRHLTRAIALRPRDAGLFEERARLWRDAGALDRALSDAHRAAYLAPGLSEAQNTLGTVLFALGRVGAARERFARAAVLTPDAAHVQSNLCFAAFAGGALEQALMACDEALRIAPDHLTAQRNRERVEAALSARQTNERSE